MPNLQWNYVDPLAMRNIESERRELGLDSLRRRALTPPPTNENSGSIRWWVLKYEEAGRALISQAA